MKKIPKMVKENLLKNLIIDWVDLMYDCMMYSLLLSLLNGVHKIAETAVSLSEDIGRSFAFKTSQGFYKLQTGYLSPVTFSEVVVNCSLRYKLFCAEALFYVLQST